MKPDIHPEYKEVKVVCSCGNVFVTRSTVGRDQLSLEVCSKCHPYFTGTQKIIDTAGRVDRFKQKYSTRTRSAAKTEKAPEAKVEKKTEKKAAKKSDKKSDEAN